MLQHKFLRNLFSLGIYSKAWFFKTVPVLLHWLAYQVFLQVFFLAACSFGFFGGTVASVKHLFTSEAHSYEEFMYCFADAVRKGQHYHTKGIYWETCKLHPYFCIFVLILIPLCLYYLFVLFITGAIIFSEPHRDANLGRESRMLFKMVLICLPISFLRDLKTE